MGGIGNVEESHDMGTESASFHNNMGMESADTSPQFILSGPHFQSLHVRKGPHFIPKSTKNLSKILGQSAGESPQFLLSAVRVRILSWPGNSVSTFRFPPLDGHCWIHVNNQLGLRETVSKGRDRHPLN
ncbi:hypothetical protein OUZ56_018488 [Daphnia magna]|uniref:Uncharacterized protein n=1 Tax=Daphnia magna TaxID=35525 RepID=A0ABQ9Z918_9CRUS|nr:hypothetical protein OUZ56_018488 [Daphnia magna]